MNSREPLTPEERELARLLGGRLDKAPPVAVDAAVLAAARAAVRATQAGQGAEPISAATDTDTVQERRQLRRRPRWPAVAGIAASVVFAVGLAWQLQPEPPPAPTMQEMAAPAPAGPQHEPAPRPAAPAAEDATRSVAAARNAQVADAASAPAAASASPQRAPQPIARSAPVPAPEPVPARSPAAPSAKVETMDAPAPQAFRARAAEAARRPPQPAPAPAPPAPAAMSAPAPAAESVSKFARTQPAADVQDESNLAGATASTSLSAAAVQLEVAADARLTRRQWLQKIRQRRDAGDVDVARASLEHYLAQYPETRLPRDLQPLLAD